MPILTIKLRCPPYRKIDILQPTQYLFVASEKMVREMTNELLQQAYTLTLEWLNYHNKAIDTYHEVIEQCQCPQYPSLRALYYRTCADRHKTRIQVEEHYFFESDGYLRLLQRIAMERNIWLH